MNICPGSLGQRGVVLENIRGSVLLLSYGGGHAAALAPVAKRLQAANVDVQVLGLTTAAAYYQARGLMTIGIADLCGHVPGYANVAARGAVLAAEQASHHAVPEAESRAYLGVGYLALERELGAYEAERRYARLGRQAFLPRDFFARLFEVARPSVVVATSAPRAERAALEMAFAAGVPSLCVVDLYAPFEIEWCAAPRFAHRICVLNDAVADRFRKHGAKDDRLVVTGNPAFDRLGALDIPAARARYRKAHGLAETDRLVVWISQPEPAIHPFSGAAGDPNLPLQIERQLADQFAGEPCVHLLMRLHPSEDRPPAVEQLRLRYSRSDEPLDDVLCAADCIVTTSSTVGLEAALIGVPVVQITNSVFSPDLPLAELGFATAAEDAYTAAGVVRQILLANPASSRRLEQAEECFDATSLVSKQIFELLKR